MIPRHGLYYLQSRYYSPEWGRFLNADGYVSTGTGLLSHNLYAYCSNNPVNLRDPDGNFARTLPTWSVVAQSPQTQNFNNFVATATTAKPTVTSSKASVLTAKPDYVENVGFNMSVDLAFLNKQNCLTFAQNAIDMAPKGAVENNKLYTMSQKRIAVEVYAHAVIYYSSVLPNIALTAIGWDNNIFHKAMLAANDEGGGMGLNVNNDDRKWLGYYLVWHTIPGIK